MNDCLKGISHKRNMFIQTLVLVFFLSPTSFKPCQGLKLLSYVLYVTNSMKYLAESTSAIMKPRPEETRLKRLLTPSLLRVEFS